MQSRRLSPAMAELELALLTAESKSFSDADFYEWLREQGLPSEAAIRLKALIGIAIEVGGRTVNIGKLIALTILEFVKSHPNLAIGIAIGAAISVLVAGVPLIGPYLAPFAAALGVSLGAITGHVMDKARGNSSATAELKGMGVLAITSEAIDLAKIFFGLLIKLFQCVIDGALTARPIQ